MPAARCWIVGDTMDTTDTERAWPSLRVDWTAIRQTLHMWTQIVGKIRLAHAPLSTTGGRCRCTSARAG